MTRSLDWQAVAPAGLQLLATCPRTLSVWNQIILPLYCHILPALLPSGLCALGKCMGSLNLSTVHWLKGTLPCLLHKELGSNLGETSKHFPVLVNLGAVIGQFPVSVT